MQLSAEVIGESVVVVVDTEIGRANLAHPQLLLLIGACRHGVAVLQLCRRLLLPDILHLFQQLHALVNLDEQKQACLTISSEAKGFLLISYTLRIKQVGHSFIIVPPSGSLDRLTAHDIY